MVKILHLTINRADAGMICELDIGRDWRRTSRAVIVTLV